MSEFRVSLHPDQLDVYKDPARFKIVVAGRRWGKSRLALYTLFIEAMKSNGSDVYYIAPTFEQGKRIMWRLMKEIGATLIEQAYENVAILRLINGRQIFICGSDRPDSIRGVSMAYAVLDEYASMKPMVWEEIIEPALMDCKGSALFIGTPAGKNHFYDLYHKAQKKKDWATWQFKSADNPFLDKDEVQERINNASTQIARQEYEASFESFSSGIFKESWIKQGDEPKEGEWYISVDLAGFEAVTGGRGRSSGILDESVIIACKVTTQGWFIGEIEHGRWDVRETATRILRMGQQKRAVCIGIEIGALKNAIGPYMEDTMRRIGYYPRIETATHGGRSKVDRVVWGLQGRFERGVITLRRDAEFIRPFTAQLLDFPNELSHDDMVDCMAYLDQIAVTPYGQGDMEEVNDDYEPFDLVSGY